MAQKLKILLIDDSPTDREIAQEALKSIDEFEIELKTASTGMDGLEKVTQEKFDLIIVDYKMPGLSGIDFMKKLKEKNIDIPVIMATGAGDEKTAVEAMRTGADDYLPKDEISKGAYPLAIKRTLERYAVKKEKELLEAETKEYAQKLKKINEELKKVSQLKSDFVSIVSHELRTPLSIVKEGVSLVLDEIPGKISGKQKKVLATSKNNIDRLARIIESLLNISKIESGKLELNREEVDVVKLIKRVADSFVAEAKEKGLELKLNFAKDSINANVDADKIIQVFTNLLGNALKFTEKGQIEISVVQKDGELECAVSDTGIGIAKDNLPKLFTKFQQFSRVPGAGEKGTGLGLSIAKGIIELHQGKIWAESEPGKGAKFTFTIPGNPQPA